MREAEAQPERPRPPTASPTCARCRGPPSTTASRGTSTRRRSWRRCPGTCCACASPSPTCRRGWRRGRRWTATPSTNTTSVYAGVAVFPMLPERLSNDLTSLNPGEDRLAVVVDIDVAPTGRVYREAVSRALVRNHAKLDYESVGLWLEGQGPAAAGDAPSAPRSRSRSTLQDEAARRLIALRQARGAARLRVPGAAGGGGPRPRGGHPDGAAEPRPRHHRELHGRGQQRARAVPEARGRSAIRRVVREPKRWDRIVALAAEVGRPAPAGARTGARWRASSPAGARPTRSTSRTSRWRW